MRALAWDDDPNGYMSLLKNALMRTAKIAMQIEHDIGHFSERLQEEKWDFVVTDLVAETEAENTPERLPGIEIARRFSSQLPVYIVTSHYDGIRPAKLGIPDGVLLKSKSLNPSWMALDIVDDLKRRGVFVDHDRVFVIYGHDRTVSGFHHELEAFLGAHGVKVELVKGANLGTEILNGLLQKMNRCAAFIAVCTPDDAVADMSKEPQEIAYYQPRQNVLFEMGAAMGLSRGLERLIVLKKWGPSVKDQTKLPSDFGGVLTIRVEQTFEQAKTPLIARLKELNVVLKEVSSTHQ